MMIGRWTFVLALTGVLAAASALADERAGARVEADAPAEPTRIVSIGGAVTEILYALGLEDSIVAVDTTSAYPSDARSKPQVGYMRALSAEGVLAVDPALILAVEGSGPPEVIHVLETAAVPFVVIPDEPSTDGVIQKIRRVAEAVGAEAEGERLAEAVSADIAAVTRMTAEIDEERSAAFVMGMQGGSTLAAGEETSADAILALAGARNALTGFDGFQPVSDEALLAAAPEAVVTMSERNHPVGAILESAAFAATPAGREGRSISMSGSYLLGFGPRTAHAARDLAAALYPERELPELPARPWTGGAGF